MKIIFLAIAALISACQSNSNSQQTNVTPSGVHKVVVEEILQTTNYTYLRVKEGDSEQWLAVSKMQASVGEVYYYEGGLVMTAFESKELNRPFKEVLFLDKISSTSAPAEKEILPTPPHGSNPHSSMPVSESKTNTNTTTEKIEIKIEPAKGGITIAELFKNKQSYSGKTVKIKGQVIKFNPYILNTNWVHIQDGTENAGKFDITATTAIEVKAGDVITLEGIIALNKDFGYGYVYEVLMEDAKLVK